MPSAAHGPCRTITAAALAASLAATAGCGATASADRTPAPPTVSVVTVKPRTIPLVWKFTGRTQGYRDVQVRARVSGVIVKRAYTEGSFVKQGDLLFAIDPTQYQAAVAQQQAVVAQNRAGFDQAQRNLDRIKPLYKTGVVSGKQYDDAVSALAVAKANLEAAEAALEQKKIDLSYTRITAPISGISGKAGQSVGSLVAAGQEAPLTTVAQTNPMYVYFSIADNDYFQLLQAIKDGSVVAPKDDEYQVKLLLGDGSTFSQTGKLDFMNNVIDPNTGTIQMRAVFPNPDGRLVPNQFVRVFLKGAVRPHAILIPQRAVMENAKGQFVFVVDAANKIESRPVTTGTWDGADWLVEKGLEAGAHVVTDGLQTLRPGMTVAIAPGASTALAPGVSRGSP